MNLNKNCKGFLPLLIKEGWYIMENFKLKNINPLCWILAHDNNIMEKFIKLADRCRALTSDYGISIKAEVYPNNIESYIIKGTRCKLRITYDNASKKVVRKPYSSKPIMFSNFEQYNCLDLEEIVNEIMENY